MGYERRRGILVKRGVVESVQTFLHQVQELETAGVGVVRVGGGRAGCRLGQTDQTL